MGVLNFFFPKRCILCNFVMNADSVYDICDDCRHNIPITDMSPMFPVTQRAKYGRKYFTVCSAPFYYAGPIRKGIISLKFRGRLKTAEYLALHMRDMFDNVYFYNSEKIDMIIPVPLSKRRLRKRGFNQSLILAECMNLPFTIRTDILFKIKDTKKQSLINDHNRRVNNVKDVYAVYDRDKVFGKTVLLVDDVVTTGATVNECAKALMSAGAQKVLCICAARGGKRSLQKG